MYMMSAELQLSINSLLVLNPFIVNVMTSGSSCGYLTPLASHSEKKQSHPHWDNGTSQNGV